MKDAFRLISLSILFLALTTTSSAQPANTAADQTRAGPLQALVDGAVRQTLEKFGEQKLQTNQLAITLVDLRESQRPVPASYRGDAPIYPASVVKLFYLAAAHRWLDEGKLRDTDELRRALRDMIVDSSNEATHYVVDLLTGTTSGPELSPEELKEWVDKRDAVNRYFASLGYTNINVNKKPWCEGPYGRETQAIKAFKPSRNMLTTDATARLMVEIVSGRAVSGKRSGEMMELLKRDSFKAASDPDDQAHGFSGRALPPDAKLWSKAGWTSQVRHDAAYIELGNGAKFVLVIFTSDHANEREIIPALARVIVSEMRGEAAR